MVPTLQPFGAPVVGSLGKGKLIDIISCEVYEENNGEFYMEFTYPITGALYQDLIDGGSITAAYPIEAFGGWSPTMPPQRTLWKMKTQWFDIVSHSIPIDGVVTFRAEHASRRLAKRTILGPQGAIGSRAFPVLHKSNPSLNETYSYPQQVLGVDFSVGGVNPTGNDTAYVPVKSLLAALIGSKDSHAALWGTEFGFDASLFSWRSGGSQTFMIYCFGDAGRGADRGVKIWRGVNMLDLEKDVDKAETYNAVIPFWKIPGHGGITDMYLTPVTSDAATEAIVYPTTPITPTLAVPFDCTDAFSSEPTQAQLVQYAQDWLDAKQPWLPIDSLSVDFANDIIEGTEIYIGDIVTVCWRDADVYVKMRVNSYKYDVLAERYTEINLGTPQTEYVAVTGDTPKGTSVPSGGSSGGMTTLWTNSALSSSFAAQEVLLSESIEDFDFIMVGYVFSTSNQNYSSMIVPASTLWPGGRSCDLRVNAGSYNRTGARTFYATSATAVQFNAASYNTNTANGYVIPEHIIGIKL